MAIDFTEFRNTHLDVTRKTRPYIMIPINIAQHTMLNQKR
jgi:hypothetical protein